MVVNQARVGSTLRDERTSLNLISFSMLTYPNPRAKGVTLVSEVIKEENHLRAYRAYMDLVSWAGQDYHPVKASRLP